MGPESLAPVERSPAGRAACLVMLRCDDEIANRVGIVDLSRDKYIELITRNQYRAPVVGELHTGDLTALEEPDFSEHNDLGRSHVEL